MFEGKKSSTFHLPHNSLRKRIIHMTSSCGHSKHKLLSPVWDKRYFCPLFPWYHIWSIIQRSSKDDTQMNINDSELALFLIAFHLFFSSSSFSPLSFIHFYLRWTYSKTETGLFCLLNPIWMTVHYFSTHCLIRSLTYLHFWNKSTFSPTQ